MPYSIREVLETKTNKSGRFFLVEWTGRKRNSWVLEEDVPDSSQELVLDFLKESKKKTPAKKRSRSASVKKESAKASTKKKARVTKNSTKATPARKRGRATSTRDVVADKKQKVVAAPEPPLPVSPEAKSSTRKSSKRGTKKKTPAAKRGRVSKGKSGPTTATKKQKKSTSKAKSKKTDAYAEAESVVYKSRLRSASVSRPVNPIPVRMRSRSRSPSPVVVPKKKKKTPVKKRSVKQPTKTQTASRKKESRPSKKASKTTEAAARPIKKSSKKTISQKKARQNKAVQKQKASTVTTPTADDVAVDDLALVGPVVSALCFLVVSVWALLSVFTRTDSLSFDDVPEQVPMEWIRAVLLPVDVSLATAFLAITIPALVVSLSLFHSFAVYSVDNVGQFVARVFTADVLILAVLLVKPRITNDQIWVEGLFLFSLAATIVDVLVYSGGNTFPQNLQNLLHVLFRGWLVLGQNKDASLVANCFIMTQYIVASHGIHAAAIVANTFSAKFLNKVFNVAAHAFTVIGLPYLAVNMFATSTVPAAIAVAYGITDTFLTIVSAYAQQY